jgi:hypothetical protein
MAGEAAPYKYEATMKGVLGWAQGELEHVGRIAAVKDPKIQYSYALSTVNGMAHLKDALFELVGETEHADKKRDLLRIHDQVIRVMKHLIREYKIDLEPIRNFNVKGVLSNLGYLNNSSNNGRNEEEEEETDDEDEEEENENENNTFNNESENEFENERRSSIYGMMSQENEEQQGGKRGSKRRTAKRNSNRRASKKTRKSKRKGKGRR